MSPVQQKIVVTAALAATTTPRGGGFDVGANIDRIIRGRFASRAFTSRAVPRQTITEILNVARFAPSGANTQPWRVYAASRTKKDEISCALLKAHEQACDQHTSEYQYYASELPEPYLSRRNQFGRLFYGSLDIEQSDMVGRARQTAKNYGFFGAPVVFIPNVMIAAGARGLQTCPQETFAKYHALLRELLPIPPEEMVVCGMSIGFAEDDCLNKGSLMPKAAVEEFAQFTGFED